MSFYWTTDRKTDISENTVVTFFPPNFVKKVFDVGWREPALGLSALLPLYYVCLPEAACPGVIGQSKMIGSSKQDGDGQTHRQARKLHLAG